MLKTPALEVDQMDDMFIISSFVVIDDVMKVAGHQRHMLAQVSDAEVVTVAIVAAKYFQNHFERVLCVMKLGGYLQK
jgi:heptaprenylglyceryl phosphate synthase